MITTLIEVITTGTGVVVLVTRRQARRSVATFFVPGGRHRA